MNKGFIALISTLIITTVLVGVALMISFKYHTLATTLMLFEQNTEARTLTRSCIEIGRLLSIQYPDKPQVQDHTYEHGTCTVTTTPHTPVSEKHTLSIETKIGDVFDTRVVIIENGMTVSYTPE